MTDPAAVATLEALFALPAAEVGPDSPGAELIAAGKVLLARGDWESSELASWLRTTSEIHFPDETGARCERDGDPWPCFDVKPAQNVAFTIGYTREDADHTNPPKEN